MIFSAFKKVVVEWQIETQTKLKEHPNENWIPCFLLSDYTLITLTLFKTFVALIFTGFFLRAVCSIMKTHCVTDNIDIGLNLIQAQHNIALHTFQHDWRKRTSEESIGEPLLLWSAMATRILSEKYSGLTSQGVIFRREAPIAALSNRCIARIIVSMFFSSGSKRG